MLMNFYECAIKFEDMMLPFGDETRNLFPDTSVEHKNNWIRENYGNINRKLGKKCDDDESIYAYIWDAKVGEVRIIFALDTEKCSFLKAMEFFKKFFVNNYDVCNVKISECYEITAKSFNDLGERGDENDLIRRFHADANRMGISYFDNRMYELDENLITEGKLTLEDAIKESKEILGDNSLVEELMRIYSDENEKEFRGNPVHYKVTASNTDSAMNIITLLSKALFVNKRIVGRRINRICNITEGCYDEDDIENMLKIANGNIVVIEMSGSRENHGNYASAYEEVVTYFEKMIQKYALRTLFIFVENTSHPGFSGHLVNRVAEEINIIDLKEGCGEKNEVIDFIEKKITEKGYTITKQEIEKMLPEKMVFSMEETYEIYNKWFRNGLKNRVYKAYKNCDTISVTEEKKESEPYDVLQKMVGLTEIKKVVDEVINSARIQKMRSEMGMDSFKTSLHMEFTGNPGSAKTTVARLIAQILAKEGVLDTGKYVECGRADLVGKYVGWTAKQVRSKFREARGGVLFIDEAYSLVDDYNSFGDEAINTIVQEMENYRNDTIVIFAGYPKKMKAFLEKNEGLRSRIAFHLDFPDYNGEELTEIFKLMVNDKGYKLDDGVESKVREIFESACKNEEFGNGRFARNLLEQAMMAQSARIMKENRGKKISKKTLAILKPEDFDVNIKNQYAKDERKPFGFAV